MILIKNIFKRTVDPNLRKAVKDSEKIMQKYIDEMKADGTMTQISEKWFGKDVVSR
mgnify:CR=1 FL=1